jgi:hypothetical protein
MPAHGCVRCAIFYGRRRGECTPRHPLTCVSLWAARTLGFFGFCNKLLRDGAFGLVDQVFVRACL